MTLISKTSKTKLGKSNKKEFDFEKHIDRSFEDLKNGMVYDL